MRKLLATLLLTVACADEGPREVQGALPPDASVGMDAARLNPWFDATFRDVPQLPSCVHLCETLATTRCEAGKVSVCVADALGCRRWEERVRCAEDRCDGATCAGCANECTASTCTDGQASRCTLDLNGCRKRVDGACISGACYDETRCAEVVRREDDVRCKADLVAVGPDLRIWTAGTCIGGFMDPPSAFVHTLGEDGFERLVPGGSGRAAFGSQLGVTARGEAVFTSEVTHHLESRWLGIISVYPALSSRAAPHPAWAAELRVLGSARVALALRRDDTIVVGVDPQDDSNKPSNRQPMLAAYEPSSGMQLWARVWPTRAAVPYLAADGDAVYAVIGLYGESRYIGDYETYLLARLSPEGTTEWVLSLEQDVHPTQLASRDGKALLLFRDDADRAQLATFENAQRTSTVALPEGTSQIVPLADGSLLARATSGLLRVRDDKVVSRLPIVAQDVAAAPAPIELVVAAGQRSEQAPDAGALWLIRPEAL